MGQDTYFLYTLIDLITTKSFQDCSLFHTKLVVVECIYEKSSGESCAETVHRLVKS